jgi:hypothetical protein
MAIYNMAIYNMAIYNMAIYNMAVYNMAVTIWRLQYGGLQYGGHIMALPMWRNVITFRHMGVSTLVFEYHHYSAPGLTIQVESPTNGVGVAADTFESLVRMNSHSMCVLLATVMRP